MGIVTTIPEKCRRCYSCVRECPARAIKVENGQATVIEERCIACGNCVKVCAQQAKLVESSIDYVKQLIAGQERVFACLAPSFPAAFDRTAPRKLISATRKLGFHEVWEVAFGAELVSREYAKLFKNLKDKCARIITTPCPAIVAYVEKYMPALHEALAPVVSPMVAIARAIRQRHGNNIRVVFIGPCLAKKNEITDPRVAGLVDAVLTYKELARMFEEAGIVLDALEEAAFDSPRCRLGRSFPISGGLLKTAGLSTDILESDIVITEGKDRVLAALKELAEGQSEARFFDVLFCEGCINGPKMLNDLSVFARREILADFVRKQNESVTPKEFADALAEFKDLDLGRTFTRQNLVLPQPSEGKILAALQSMKKLKPEDEFNCGACGYPTCREKAIAVCQGLAEAEMCLPYLVEELEATCKNLELSHKELASAQQRLVQTERLASMGQLSAGVAHEINNPLGTILLYSNLLLKCFRDSDPLRSDLQMIASEATRCKDIVRGLLNFARQSRVSKSATDLHSLVDEVVSITAPKAEAAGVRVIRGVQDGLPELMIDRTQIRQALVNLVENAVDACPRGGEATVSARLSKDGAAVEFKVRDNGCGIPQEHLSRLFTPFFTTKEQGKGTGLGLAIVYGVVKMHSGDISVDSAIGKGTTFCISLPLGQEEARHVA